MDLMDLMQINKTFWTEKRNKRQTNEGKTTLA